MQSTIDIGAGVKNTSTGKFERQSDGYLNPNKTQDRFYNTIE